MDSRGYDSDGFLAQKVFLVRFVAKLFLLASNLQNFNFYNFVQNFINSKNQFKNTTKYSKKNYDVNYKKQTH